jgi:type II secretion system protein G
MSMEIGEGAPLSGGDNGFTLIEILIVVVILGVLAAIVTIAVTSVTAAAPRSACRTDFSTVETAVEGYKAEFGNYPTAGVSPGLGTGTDNAIAALLTQSSVGGTSVGPWMKEAPYSQGHYQIVVETDGSGNIDVYSAPASLPVIDDSTNGGVLVGAGIGGCNSAT